MTRYKVTRIFILEAENREEARLKVSRDGEESLEWEKIVEVPARKPAKRNGWVDAAREQLGSRPSK